MTTIDACHISLATMSRFDMANVNDFLGLMALFR